MQESAQAALSWVRSHADELGLDPDWFAEHDVHIHVPAGAVPKDGPSAGRRDGDRDRLARHAAAPCRDEVGMTGEITLTGQVLQIGGVREKVLAAQRAGLKKVILPRENEADLTELPPETRAGARVRSRRHDPGGARGRADGEASPARPRPAPERAGG